MKLERAFTKLIKEHEAIILKVCNVYCREAADRDDLYQDILIQLWKAFPRFSGQSKVTTWMYRIAFNTAVSRFRKVQKAPKPEPIPDHMPAETTADSEQLQALYAALDCLNKIERAIMMLYLDGVKYQEIGEIMGLSESNVGFKINRIKGKLRQHLKQS